MWDLHAMYVIVWKRIPFQDGGCGIIFRVAGFVGYFKVCWCILKGIPWKHCSLCVLPSLLYSHKGLSLPHTCAHTNIHKHWLLPLGPIIVPIGTLMTTYHHHRRDKENFIYSALLLSLSIFLIWLFFMCLFCLLLGLFFHWLPGERSRYVR